MEAEELISCGSRANFTKWLVFEEHTLRSAWVGESVYYLLCCSICVWAVYSAGGKLFVSLSLYVCTWKSRTEVYYWMCVSVSVCSLSILMLIIFVCAGVSAVAVLPLSLVDSWGAAVPLQISFLVSASSVWQIAWHVTARLSSTHLGLTQMA